MNNKETKALELRDELLRDIRDLSPMIYDTPDFYDCEQCGEKEEIEHREDCITHDGYELCRHCIGFYCHTCRECEAIYDNDLDACPLCGGVKK